MATLFIEPILGYIKSRLQSNLAAKLDVIDAEKADFTLDDVETFSYYEAKKLSIPQYPSIEIYPITSAGEDMTYNSVRSYHTIAVRVYATGDDEENIAKRVYRYMRAITEVIKTDDDLGGNVDLCKFAGHDYEDWELMDGGAYVYGGIVYFEIDQEETVQ